jgi:hypothetical protein
MTYPDPFLGQPADEAQAAPAEAPREDPWASQAAAQPSAIAPSSGGLNEASLTFKGGTNFDAPWLVLKDSLENLAAILTGPRAAVLKTVLDRAQVVATAFSSGYAGAATSGAAHAPAARQAAPAAATAPPANAPACPAGWTYRTGMKKDGSGTYQAFFPPRGDNTKPIFFD